MHESKCRNDILMDPKIGSIRNFFPKSRLGSWDIWIPIEIIRNHPQNH